MRLELLLVADENKVAKPEFEDTVSIFKGGLTCLIKDRKIGLKLLTFLLNFIDFSNQGSVSNDYISISKCHPHCLFIMFLPCCVHKLDVCDLIEISDDIKHVCLELGHPEKVDDELRVERVEPDIRLNREVLFDGDE